jgi:hypothetical protein
METGNFDDPERSKLLKTREAVVEKWMNIADALDVQGEVALAGDVRSFAGCLPPILTDKERLAARFAQHQRARGRAAATTPPSRLEELTR